MSRILCWDLEIKKSVESVGGWPAATRGDAGISVLAISDSDTGRYHFYDENTLDEAVDHLNSADMIVGFNSINFDANVVFGLTSRSLLVPHYDICKKIQQALGRPQKGYKLTEVCDRTLNLRKNGNGEFAPTLVSQGRWAELFDYCTNDVHMTKELYNHIVEFGSVMNVHNEELEVERPFLLEYA